jgi:hypothetical protein
MISRHIARIARRVTRCPPDRRAEQRDTPGGQPNNFRHRVEFLLQGQSD